MPDDTTHELVKRTYSFRDGTARVECSCGWTASATHHFEGDLDGRRFVTQRLRTRFAEHQEAAAYPQGA